MTTRSRLVLPGNEEAIALFGPREEHLRAMERTFGVRILSRGNELLFEGETRGVALVEELFRRLVDLMAEGHALASQDVYYAIDLAQQGRIDRLAEIFSEVLVSTVRGKPIRGKTLGQRRYLEAMRKNHVVFGIGPAGTGKTYLAMAMAIAAFKAREVNRIILTRPAVEAGEKLGFLPGDLQEKVNPYLRPLYDALYDILGVESFERQMQRGQIEVAPLAYMRGRTLDDSFVILDEAQNTTPKQMKMFLTRLGFGSRAVITGDVTQVDLPQEQPSGLEDAERVLAGIEGIAFVHLTERDVVRHPLVQKIIKAYEHHEQRVAGEDPEV